MLLVGLDLRLFVVVVVAIDDADDVVGRRVSAAVRLGVWCLNGWVDRLMKSTVRDKSLFRVGDNDDLLPSTLASKKPSCAAPTTTLGATNLD